MLFRSNHADRGFYGVKVEIDLLNRAGAPVGTTVDQIQFVDGHKVWNFKALVIDPDAVSAAPARVSWQH